MTIRSERIGSGVQLFLCDRLDTAAAPMLEEKLQQLGDDITDITLDLMELSYISSMGMRVLLQAHKTYAQQGRKLVIRNMTDSVREVFEMTGFIKLIVLD